MTDDDKQPAEPDPWAGLDADAQDSGGGDAGGDDAAFIFDMLGDDPAAPPQPAAAAEESGGASGEGAAVEEFAIDPPFVDGAAEPGVPLAVFPRPDAEHGQQDDMPPFTSDVDAAEAGRLDEEAVEGDRPGIFSVEDSGDEPADAALHDPAADDSGSLASSSAGDDSVRDFLFSTSQDGTGESADPAADPPSEEASFTAGGFPSGDSSPFTEGSPFAEAGQADPFAGGEHLSAGGAAAIPITTAMASQTAAPRKKKSALGQLIGVVLGGVAAIPVTLGILLWGFQKDPFKVARMVPEQVAFLVPQSLRQPARPARSAPSASRTGPSLDDLSTAQEQPADATPEPPPMPADAVADTTAPAEPKEGEEDGVKAAMKKADEGEEPAAANVLALPADVPEELAEQFRAALARLGTAEDVEAALARLNAEPPAPVAMPAEPVVVPTVPVVVPTAPAVDEPPPLDLTDVETAVAEAAEAFDALEAATDLDAADRQRLMVGWYRRLAALGEQLVLVETAAVAAGRPLEQAPEAVERMLERIRGSEAAVADLRTLGRMWMAAQKRRADGMVLVATVESSRQLGPYWSTRVTMAVPDGTGRAATVISRLQPAVDIGEPIVITGVLFDADTVWAADMRPLSGRPAVDVGVPEIGIPAVDEPRIPMPKLDPSTHEDPPVKKAAVGGKPADADGGSTDDPRPAEPDPAKPGAKPAATEPETKGPVGKASAAEGSEPDAQDAGEKEPAATEAGTDEPDAQEADSSTADEPQPAAS